MNDLVLSGDGQAPPPALVAEPEWIRAAADERGYQWARRAWRAAAAEPGAWFDHAKADAVVKLWPTVFVLTEDRFAGKPFPLIFWQEIVVRLLVGWKIPTEIVDPETQAPTLVDVRLFRRLMLWIPRKNGKSEFLAALAILFFALEGTVAGQGFCFARDENQARIILNKMKAMLASSPRLKGKAQAQQKSIWLPGARALFQLLSGRPQGKHGLSPTVICGDEMHEWRSRELETFLRQGTGARLQPIELYASTAGLKSAATGVELFDESTAILEGRLEDPTTLVVMFAAQEDDDWQSEETWRRVNPSLGLSPTIAFLRREAAKARDNPRAEADFRRYHCNQWVSAYARWLAPKAWEACAPDPTAWRRYPAELAGRRCFLAFDVSSTQDITGLLALFPPEAAGERVKIIARGWIPEDSLSSRKANGKADLARFVAAGALETTPGNYVDQNYLKAGVEEWLSAYSVEKIGFDPWNARKLFGDLVTDGAPQELFVEMRQGIQTLGEPSKHFERLVYSGQLDHGGNPLLKWMAGHVEVRFDLNMNYMPSKKGSAEKIDLIVAGVMAAGLAYPQEIETPIVPGVIDI